MLNDQPTPSSSDESEHDVQETDTTPKSMLWYLVNYAEQEKADLVKVVQSSSDFVNPFDDSNDEQQLGNMSFEAQDPLRFDDFLAEDLYEGPNTPETDKSPKLSTKGERREDSIEDGSDFTPMYGNANYLAAALRGTKVTVIDLKNDAAKKPKII